MTPLRSEYEADVRARMNRSGIPGEPHFAMSGGSYRRADLEADYRRFVASRPQLTCNEQREQAARCGCRGSDDLCVCQNMPDTMTVRARQALSRSGEAGS